jgi:hypothetical protein
MSPLWLTCVVLIGCNIARFYIDSISVTPLDIGDACSLLSFRRSAISPCHMRLMVRFNYDYLVIEINDTKNG